MKIAIVHPSLAIKGGAQNIVVWLAWGLRRRGHEVVVLTVDYDPALWPAKYTEGLAVERLGEPVPLINSSWLRLRHFAKVLRRRLAGFDLVNCHNSPANLWVARACRGCRDVPPVVWYCQEPNRKIHWQETNRHLVARAEACPDGRYNAHLRAEVERDRRSATRSRHRRRKRARDVAWDVESVQAVDRALVNSRFSQESFRRVFGVEAAVCHLGIPTDGEPPDEPRGDYLAVVSPLSRKKNVHNVIEALSILVHQRGRGGVRLRIVGDGSARGELEALVAERGLGERVEFLGYLPDAALAEFYARARLSVYVPIDEPFGLVPVESMWRGTPPVVSSHGGPLDSVVHGETGLHVDPFDPAAIAAAIAELYDDGERLAALSEAGRRRVRDEFSLERFLDRFEALVLAPEGGGGWPTGIRRHVERLPEIYQPVYGHPEYDGRASRACDDRLAVLTEVLSAYPRPPEATRVLDVGCAQGYFCLQLAEAGYQVAGIDARAENIALCQALDAERGQGVDFACQALTEDYARAVPDGHYHVILAFSVLHHLCHDRSFEQARRIVRMLARKTECLVAELARADEPVYWAKSLPANPRDLLDGFAFVTPIAHTRTHLSRITRPVYFASNHLCVVSGTCYPFTQWRASSHHLEAGSHLGSRRYFFSDELVIKQYRMDVAGRAEVNRREMLAEKRLLERYADRVSFLPKLRGYQDSEDLILVRDRQPGELLSDAIATGRPYDPLRVTRDVLDQLVELEHCGLYHDDLRPWNVLLGEDGGATLIDFGAVSEQRPADVFDAFLTFVHDVVQGTLPDFAPFRKSRRSVELYPEPYRRLALHVTSTSETDLTFAGIRAMWNQEPTEPLDRDRRLDVLSRNYARLEQAYDESTERLLANERHLARRVARLEQMADALTRENRRLRRCLRLVRARSRLLRLLRRLFGER